MKRLLCIVLTLVVLISVQACNDNKKAKNYNEKTKVDADGLTFITQGIKSGMAEVKLSELAQKNSKNPNVISFAKMMITDHTNMGKELQGLADDQLVTGLKSDTLDVDHNKIMKSLATKTGAEFDKEYMQVMVADHEKAIKLFKNGATNQDNEVKKLAEKGLPNLQSHLNQANAICTNLK
jgi:putative membrane protein